MFSWNTLLYSFSLWSGMIVNYYKTYLCWNTKSYKKSLKTSKTNLNNHETNKNIHENCIHWAWQFGHANKTKPTWQNDKYQQEINKLKRRNKTIKQSKKQQHDAQTEMHWNNINLESKNENSASVSHGGQQEHVELYTVVNFLE